MNKRFGLLFLAAFLITPFAGCRNNNEPRERDMVVTVTVNPQNATVERGRTIRFEAVVVVTGNASAAVNWNVDGNTSGGTNVDDTGLLTVAQNEESNELTVTARSVFDGGRFDAATVTVTFEAPAPGTSVRLVGIPNWNPPGVAMTEDNGRFVWQGDVTANSTFRFSLTDTNDWDDGSWFAPAQNGTPAAVGVNPMTYFANYPGTAWSISAGWYRFTVNPAEETLFVERPVTVTEVIVDGPPEIRAGSSTAPGDFSAAVRGTNVENETVTWSIAGNAGTDFAAGTSMHQTSGVLTVALNETATSLTIRANSVSSPWVHGQRTITVDTVPVDPPPGNGDNGYDDDPDNGYDDDPGDDPGNGDDGGELGGVRITLKVEDRGDGLSVVGGILVNETVISISGTGNPTFVSFTAVHQEADSFAWIVGNVTHCAESATTNADGSTVTIHAGDHAIGRHTVRLVVFIDGVPWSMNETLSFTVER